jgi:hypothetical protein
MPIAHAARPFRRAATLSAGALLSALPLAACSSVRPPTFEPVSARAVSATPDGVLLEFTLDARNRNQEPMPLRRADYAVFLDGREVFRGSRSPEATAPTFGSQSFVLPAVVAASAVPASGSASYRITGTVSYLEPGTLAETLFDADVRVPTAPLDVAGSVPLAP